MQSYNQLYAVRVYLLLRCNFFCIFAAVITSHATKHTVIMKPKGCKRTFSQLRDHDLMCAYELALQHPDIHTTPQAYQLVATMTAPQFYISHKRTAVIVARILTGTYTPDTNTNHGRMFAYIANRAVHLKKTHQPGTPLSHIISKILRQPAPSFYLSPRVIAQIINRIKRTRQHDTQRQ